MRLDVFKKLKTKRNLKLIIGALVAANTVATFVPVTNTFGLDPANEGFNIEAPLSTDITLEEMRNMIYSSTKLTEEEKAYLYNEDMFTDILPYINQSERMKFIYRSKFDDLDIKNSQILTRLLRARGLYMGNPSHDLLVQGYNSLGNETDDTVSHEYMHATQDMDIYSFFFEPTAEMLSCEYYGAEADRYLAEAKLVKVLMEIIGAEPIKQYIYTGDFSMIEERVKPNLDEEEYAEFLECVSDDILSSNHRNLTRHRLESILQTLYFNIYGQQMKDDEIISRILDGDETLVRPYFNERLGDSYYLVNNKKSKATDGSDGVEYHYLAPISSKEERFTQNYQLN